MLLSTNDDDPRIAGLIWNHTMERSIMMDDGCGGYVRWSVGVSPCESCVLYVCIACSQKSKNVIRCMHYWAVKMGRWAMRG